MQVQSVSQAIDLFGGPAQTARRFGVGITVVSNWKSRGLFPTRWFLKVRAAAEREGFTIPEALFGFSRGSDEPPSETA